MSVNSLDRGRGIDHFARIPRGQSRKSSSINFSIIKKISIVVLQEFCDEVYIFYLPPLMVNEYSYSRGIKATLLKNI